MQAVTKKTLQIYWQHAMRHKVAFWVIIVGLIISTVLDLVQPFLWKAFINLLSADIAGGGAIQTGQLLHLVWYIFGLALLGQGVWRAMGYVNNFFQPRVMTNLMNTCYAYLQGHSFNFFNNNFVGSIVTRVRRYQGSFEKITDQFFWNLSRTAMRIVLILGILFYLRPILGVVSLLWSVIYIGFAYVFTRFKLKHDIESAKQDTKVTAHLADTITNSINVKLFSSQKTEIKSFHAITEKMFRLRKYAWDLGSHAELFQSAAVVILEFLVLYLAVLHRVDWKLTVGDFVLLQSMLYQIFERLWDFGRNIRNVYEALADANEMTEMLMEPHEVVDVPDAKALRVTTGAIEFKNVDFRYHEQTPILKHFNLAIAPGERVAFVGESGGGKSTIIKLLFRFLDIQKGQIVIDGQDIASVTQNSLRNQISLVPQEPILFHRTLLENIRYGKPNATKEEVIRAAKAAHAHEFISKFPDEYNTYVGERGVKLSGGERQRVAIARAILKNAPILVLDEATSSLDSESESLIADALKTLMAGKTSIVVAHRLSTIREADRIIVVERGRITEEGRHDELIKAESTYQKLWEIQVGGFVSV